jgi:ankyrin repeat protein
VNAALESKPQLLGLRNKAGTAALHTAAGMAGADVVRLLISKGADVNSKTREGWTPLHYAAMQGLTANAEVLLSAGADVNSETNDGKTPLATVPSWSRAGGIGELFRRHGGR